MLETPSLRLLPALALRHAAREPGHLSACPPPCIIVIRGCERCVSPGWPGGPARLPYYAARSLLRMFAALALGDGERDHQRVVAERPGEVLADGAFDQ
jgi:hypothetical protein